jgi:hypothetical protein
VMPALLTRMSMRPNCSTVVSIRARAASGRAMSEVSSTDVAPSGSTSLTTTLAPRAASRSAYARPSPRAAPVTTATRPSNRSWLRPAPA